MHCVATGVAAGGQRGGVWLQGSLLAGNEVVGALRAETGAVGFFSDVPREFYSVEAESMVATGAVPELLQGVLLTREAPWFVGALAVRSR